MPGLFNVFRFQPRTYARTRAIILSSIPAFLFSAPTEVRAQAQVTNFQVEQCDGNFLTNATQTSTGYARIRIDMQDSRYGLRIGKGPSVIESATVAQWDFSTVGITRVDGCGQGGTNVFEYRVPDYTGNNNYLFIGDCNYNCSNARTTSKFWAPPADVVSCPSTPPSATSDSFNANGPQSNFGKAFELVAGNSERGSAAADISSHDNLGGNFTIQMWVNPDSLSGTQTLMYKTSAYALRLNNNRVEFGVDTDDEGLGLQATNFVDLASFPGANAWHHVTLVFSNSQDIALYFDGVLDSTGATPTSAAPIASGKPLGVGGEPAGANFFDGTIDSARLLSVARTAQQIAADYETVAHAQRFTGSSTTTIVLNGTTGLTGTDTSNGTTANLTYTIGPFEINGSDNFFEFFAVSVGTAGSFAQSGSQQVRNGTGPPAVPGVSSPVVLSTGGLQWGWSPVSGLCTGGQYVLDGKSPGSFAGDKPATSSTETTTVGLSTNTHYTATVRAFTIYGTGNESNEVGAYTHAVAPGSLTASSSTLSSVILNWDSRGNPSHTPYEISVSSNDGDGSGNGFNDSLKISTPIAFITNSPFQALTTTFTDLSLSTTYFFRVRARSGDGTFEAESSSGAGVLTSFHPSTAGLRYISLPEPPSNLSGVALSTGDIRWTWSTVETAQNYEILSDTSGILGGPQENTDHTETALARNTRYGFIFRTLNLAGTGPDGATQYLYTLAAEPSSATVTAVSTDSLSVTWNVNSNPSFTVFQVAIATNPTFQKTISTQSLTGGSATFYGLLPQTTYYMRVRSLNGNSQPSAFATSVSTVIPGIGTIRRNPIFDSRLSSERRHHRSVALDDGGVLVLGGLDPTTATDAVQRFDPETGMFETKTSLPRRLARFVALKVSGGDVFVHGGVTDPAQEAAGVSSMTYRYDVAADSWTALSGGDTRHSHQAVAFSNGRILACGGQTATAGGESALCRIWDPDSNAWCAGTISMASARAHSALFDTGNGRIMAAGGFDGTNSLDSTEVLTPNATCPGPSWSAGPAMRSLRDRFAVAALSNSKFLFVGGRVANPTVEISTTTEVYDPVADSFGDGPTLSTARYWASATPLSEGAVLIAGGLEQENAGALQSLETYSPDSGTLSALSNRLLSARARHTAHLLSDERILYLGGDGSSAEIYNPETGRSGGNQKTTVRGPRSRVFVDIPNGALPTGVEVFIAENPLSDSLFVDRVRMIQALAALPDSLQYVEGSIREIVLVRDGKNYSETLASSVTLRFAYDDDERDGVVDETDPPLLASQLRVYTYNSIVTAWEEVHDVSLDSGNLRASVPLSHFSVYALFGTGSIAGSLAQTRVYPIPWRPGSDGTYGDATTSAGRGLLFDNLPSRAVIRIFNLAGEEIRHLEVIPSDGGKKIWDGNNPSGHTVGSGVYFAYIRNRERGGERVILKFVVER